MSNHDSTSDRDPSKRVPKSLTSDANLVGNFTMTDLMVGLLPGVTILLLVNVLLPNVRIAGYTLDSLAIPLAILGVAAGFVFVSLVPNHTPVGTWVIGLLSFHTSNSELEHEAATDELRVERVHPEYDAVERTDGAIVGMIQVQPPSMALATDEEWQTKAESFQQFLNTTVEFPIQIYSTTREFPVEEHVKPYEDRLSDPDVQENELLKAGIKKYTQWYRSELDRRQTTIRDHYVIVPVSPREIHYPTTGPLSRLATLPLVGRLLHLWTNPSREEERAAMLETLESRIQSVERGLRAIDGCQTTPVDVTDAAELLAEHWAGTPQDFGASVERFRTSALLDGPNR